ncbi:ATP phosphoribosyltransferase regulatory subunit [Hankyongella ginsenosidimutans]|uniref:ATP phosphoribosyltransferase regulatory subunit n=1 Tax=Hankyongella ginsenosidimutans TaxID=1763828 RepID=UPI001CA356AD|nr:ATP phosphoribosyltransferase regulatory subunit [Hankyongella ginsenosidimutans]
MTSRLAPGLLPEGLRDTLPPQAHGQMRLMRAILDVLSSHGYERVDPPLVEFAESLTSPIVSGARSDLFRFMDPKSQHMLAVRADITGQVARIASTRMAGQARPLRLAYMGPVLRLAGTALDADRQFLQVGGELIGNDGPAATAQTIAVAVEALRAAGLEQLSLDLVIPDLAPTLLRAHGVADAAPVLEALDAKDAGALAGHPLEALLVGLLDAAGPAAAGLARLRALDLPGAARALVDDAATTLDLLALADAAISLDPADRRGFAYQTRIGFSLFAPGVREAAVRGVPMSSARPPSRNRRLASRSISTVFWTRWLHRRRCRASICHGMPQPRPAPACAPRAG